MAGSSRESRGNRQTSPSNKGGTSKKRPVSKKTANYRLEDKVKNEIAWICVLALVIFVFFCNVGLIKGAVQLFVKGSMFGIFGVLAYIMPILLFVLAGFIYINRNNVLAIPKIVSSVVLVFVIGMITEMLTGVASFLAGEEASLANVFQQIWTTGYQQYYGGGVLFGLPIYYIRKIMSPFGVYFVLVVLALIAFVVITEKSLLRGVKEKSKKIYENHREDAVYRKQMQIQKKEEQILQKEEIEAEKILRRDRKATGVLQDPRIEKAEVSQPNKVTGDMHEIHLITPLMESEEELTPVTDIPIVRAKSVGPDSSIPCAQEPYIPVIQTTHPKETELHASSTNSKGYDFENHTNLIKSQPAQGVQIKGVYKLPPIDLLRRSDPNAKSDSDQVLKDTAIHLRETLKTFGVNVTITGISQGPTVTRYELQPEMGVKVSKIVSLSDDIKLNLAAADIRIEAPIPGKSAIGIEVPNKVNTSVAFRDLVASADFKNNGSGICFTVGKDLGGKIVIGDIAKMPHLLIAGATGSGKSVCINAIIMSLLYKAHPDDVKLILIDPKVVELNIYNGIPHLLQEVVTDAKMAAGALRWGVAEMSRRYKIFAEYNARDLESFNRIAAAGDVQYEGEVITKMPQIVIIVDELKDLMMVASKEVEDAICRLSQLARAAGIHLILATQRPSVDVITGVIKANMPSRIAFSVSSGVDSRTILDSNGAEKLLGKGDMLYYPQGYSKPVRVQGVFVSDEEVEKVVGYIKNQLVSSTYSSQIKQSIEQLASSSSANPSLGVVETEEGLDPYFEEAGIRLIEQQSASVGQIQRAFRVGFNRASRIMDQLSDAGVVSPPENNKQPRRILMTIEEFEQYVNHM